jgi:3-oxoacyl-[acyl-carrier protein] reductase
MAVDEVGAARLHGQRILVTGASRGIGRAIAIACAASGARVGVNYHRSRDRALAVCSEIGPAAAPLEFDVGDAAAVARGVEAFAAFAGGIDGLVNNAGINRPSLLVGASDADIAATIATNLVGPIQCTRAVIPAMLEARRGVIVNVSSVAAGRPSRGQAVYAATKGAIESLTRAVAVEYGRKGIRCHAIRPGAVDTDMLATTRALAEEDVLARIALKRIASAGEIAALAVFLLSDEAAYITGSIHAVDGGYGVV